MTSAAAIPLQALTTSPDLFPLGWRPGEDEVRFVSLDADAYREASFLDERLLAGGRRIVDQPWSALAEAADVLTGESDFIFHIGHVGSTLLSRLLGDSDRIFSLREPAILRTLAQVEEARATSLPVFLKLWARVYSPSQKSLIKATSFVSEIAGLLMEGAPSAKAILMFTPPEAYMATILAGPNSRLELKANAPSRLRRLGRRLGAAPWSLDSLSEGEVAAMSWITEICAMAEAAQRFPDRVLWLDFEDFLALPAAGLAAALGRLHGTARPSDVAGMLRSPDFQRYAKGPEHPYDASLRRQILANARSEHRAELNRGIDWLEAAAAAHPPLAQAARMAALAPRIG